jgi:ribosomal-protein-alanine N-acetyltransferase
MAESVAARPPHVEVKAPPLSLSLRTTRLLLRAPRASDVGRLREHLLVSADHLRPWVPAPSRTEGHPASLTNLTRWIVAERREWKLGTAHSFLVLAHGSDGVDGGGVVARIGLRGIVRGAMQTARLGYIVDVRHTRKGFATESVKAVLEFAFDRLGLHRVEAAVMPENEPSLRVLEKLGFVREGYARGYLLIAGEWRDHVLLSTSYEAYCTSHLMDREGAVASADESGR